MSNLDIEKHYAYQVGLKALIWKDGKFLMLRHPRGLLDLPGGRIDKSENETPLLEILGREIGEELGEGLKIEIKTPLFQFRRTFPERGYAVFITVYEADYVSGNVEISVDHSSFEWLKPADFKFEPKDFFHREEYDAFKKYFNSL